MAKPSITKRLTKSAALTYSELDTNFQNLADATITLTAGTGGTQVTADLNGNITLVAGTGVTLTGNNTAKTITINSSSGSTPAGSNQQIQFNNSGAFGASSGLTYDGVSIKVNGNLESVYHNGDEGGEIFLHKADTNTSITNGVTIDVFQNKLRIFENGGTNRGGYYDITNLGAGVATNLNGVTNPLSTNLDTNGKTIFDSSGRVVVNDQLNITTGSAGTGINIGYSAGGSWRIESNAGLIIGAEMNFEGAVSGPKLSLGDGPNGAVVSIGTGADPDDKIYLDDVINLNSLTTTQRNALVNPQNGDMFYNSQTHKFQGYANGTWVDLH